MMKIFLALYVTVPLVLSGQAKRATRNHGGPQQPFNVVEATIAEMQKLLAHTKSN